MGNSGDKHADLVNRMAETVGVDLGEEIRKGVVTDGDVAQMVTRCKGCSAPGACETFLDIHAGGADSPPGFCRNHDTLTRLARR